MGRWMGAMAAEGGSIGDFDGSTIVMPRSNRIGTRDKHILLLMS
ncbi:hypothetical protein [Methanococcoides alaskense]|nr:hypothetical protein [Methanococcoides alaskense]MDA0524300.1 hypothetical protein [Methanococcoides alaskense]